MNETVTIPKVEYDRLRALEEDLRSLEQARCGCAHGCTRGSRDAALDMIRRALETTGGSFDLRVTSSSASHGRHPAPRSWGR